MIGALAVAVATLVGTGALVGVGVVLHRDLAEVADQLAAGNRHPPDVQRDLDQFWNDLHQAQAERNEATDKRLHGIETAFGQSQQAQTRLVQAVNWMAPLVQRWAGQEQQR